jgi:hypothetical protein
MCWIDARPAVLPIPSRAAGLLVPAGTGVSDTGSRLICMAPIGYVVIGYVTGLVIGNWLGLVERLFGGGSGASAPEQPSNTK